MGAIGSANGGGSDYSYGSSVSTGWYDFGCEVLGSAFGFAFAAATGTGQAGQLGSGQAMTEWCKSGFQVPESTGYEQPESSGFSGGGATGSWGVILNSTSPLQIWQGHLG